MNPSISHGPDRICGAAFATRSEVLAPAAMAATSQPLATQIALDTMRRGGSAVDAAIAANAALGLMEPTGAGIGGDLFALVWEAKSAKLHGYNGSGRSPRALTYDALVDQLRRLELTALPTHGPLTVSVPGCVDGWFALHQRFGRAAFADLLAPSIRYAREGFPVSALIAEQWRTGLPAIIGFANIREQFTRDGAAPTKGERWSNPNLADSYEALARGGRAAFYEGEIAQRIAAHLKAQGGHLAVEDLARHQGEWVQPISTRYRGIDVWELPPNTQGLAALQTLNILEGYDLAAMGFGSAAHIHAVVEAIKLAFADRARHYADPQFFDVPLERLLSKDYADGRRRLIDPQRAMLSVAPSADALKTSDTVYLTTADAEGTMVSLIQSNFRGLGSGMAPAGLGFILQNRGQLFSLQPGHANVYAPGKRPFHTIIPAFASRDGKPWLSFGVMGADMQPQGHVQIILNLIDFGMNLQEAGDAPRIFWDSPEKPTGGALTDGGRVHFESGFPYESIRQLMQMGHTVGQTLGHYGGYQAIARLPEGGWAGASESRLDGQAAGY
jgi:gamma-glutamyltranspeptidase/glutathione hydrolase